MVEHRRGCERRGDVLLIVPTAAHVIHSVMVVFCVPVLLGCAGRRAYIACWAGAVTIDGGRKPLLCISGLIT